MPDAGARTREDRQENAVIDVNKGFEKKEYANPRDVAPHVGMKDNLVWLVMEPYRLKSQTVIARHAFDVEAINTTFKFLLPNEIIETVEHQWEDYECLAGRASEMLGNLGKTKTELLGAASAAKEAVKDMSWNTAFTKAGKTQIYNYRIDAALHYKTSERRRYQFVIQLMDCGDPQSDIIEPIRALEAFSSPMMKGDLVDIEVPYVFRIYTWPETWLHVTYAAVRSVQPTFRGPYVRGYPSTCDLQLDVVDLMPLYDEAFKMKNVVNVKVKTGK